MAGDPDWKPVASEERWWRGSRTTTVWSRVLHLSWPVSAEQFLRTLMRTVDLLVAGAFSPAAVAGVGLADIYAKLPARVGIGVGDASIALTSQDTGSGAVANRDEVVTQALLIGLLSSVPFVLFGLVLNRWAIGVLGASSTVVDFGAIYLAIILAGSPARQTNLIAARSIQGTGDTMTPMYINGAANVVNIVGTVALAFGVGPVPALSVAGIAIATTAAEYLASAAYLAVIASGRSELGLVVPTRLVVGHQLLRIGLPRIAEGVTDLIAEFPFNAILLTFGTEVNAAYHIGRRVWQQIVAPLSRGYAVAANVIVGNALGRGDVEDAYRSGWLAGALAVTTVGAIGLVLFVWADWFAMWFTRDPTTLGFTTSFARAYALAGPFIALYVVMAGSLRGGSETITPLVAKLVGTFVFFLGITAVFGVALEVGVLAAYVAIVADYAWRNAYVGAVYRRRRWIGNAVELMRLRGSIAPGGED